MWFKKLFAAFTKKERIAFVLATAGAIVSFVVVIGIVIAQVTQSVPTTGGQYIEGIVGQPEYVNPVLASSETDEGLVRLIYQNLYDIADSVTASPDQKTWTVHLKDGLFWQDGQKLTADDVVFTVQSIEDTDANSPLYASWQGVQVSRASELEVQFTLAAPYAFFPNNLKNLYILPKHLFADAPPGNWYLSDYNLSPIGSGPYRFVSYNKDPDGFITSYTLAAWDGTSGPHPLIQNFDFRFFNDDNALVQAFNEGQINGFGGATTEDLATVDRPYNLLSWRTSGEYAVFFNTSNNLALQDATVRQALSASIDRTDLVAQVFGSALTAAVPDYGPVPPDAPYYAAPTDAPATAAPASSSSATTATATSTATAYAETPAIDEASAAAMLDADGWAVSSSTGFRAKIEHGSSIPLAINLTVPDIDSLTKTANYLKTAWESIGVQVNITTASAADITANAIKNRSYEALLFGEALGPSSDLYSFWDSSQRFYPGLNLAIYSNPEVDRNIETARETSSTDQTAADLAVAQNDIENDYPAVFLYSPDYLYAAGNTLQGATTTGPLTDPANRFLDVGSWYLETARVLK
jgi:peptide/nickel transport system substrate-binding protein